MKKTLFRAALLALVALAAAYAAFITCYTFGGLLP